MPLSQFLFSNGWILTWLGTRLTIMAPRLFTWVPERSGHQTSYCTTGESMNPFHANISVHILHTALHAVLKALTRRNCLTIKSVLSWWSFFFSDDFNARFRGVVLIYYLLVKVYKAADNCQCLQPIFVTLSLLNSSTFLLLTAGLDCSKLG